VTLTDRLREATATTTLWDVAYTTGETEHWVENGDQVWTNKGRRYLPARFVHYDEHDLTVATLDGRVIRIPGHAIRRVETIEVA